MKGNQNMQDCVSGETHETLHPLDAVTAPSGHAWGVGVHARPRPVTSVFTITGGSGRQKTAENNSSIRGLRGAIRFGKNGGTRRKKDAVELPGGKGKGRGLPSFRKKLRGVKDARSDSHTAQEICTRPFARRQTGRRIPGSEKRTGEDYAGRFRRVDE